MSKPESAVKESAEADEQVAAANPFRKQEKSTPAAPADEKKPAAEDEKGEIQQASATKEKGDKPAVHDAETLKLIERELRDASPEEREQLFADLKGLDPPLVRQILQVRRMVRQMGQDASGSQTAQPAPETTPPGGTSQTVGGPSHDVSIVAGMRHIAPPATAESPPAAGPQTQAYAGLGMATPWGGAAPTSADSPQGPGLPEQPFGMNATRAPAAPPTQFAAARFATAPSHPANTATASMTPALEAGYASYYSPQTSVAAAGHSPPGPSTMENPTTPHAMQAQSAMQYYVGPSSHRAVSAAGATNGLPVVTPAGAMNAVGTGLADLSGGHGVPSVGIHPAFPPPHTPPGSPPPATAGADQGQYTPRPSSFSPKWNEDIQRLVALAETEAAQLRLSPESTETERQDYIEKQVYLRMLYLMSGQQERALQAIPGLQPADQEFWQQMFWALANYFDFDAIPDSSDRAAQTIAQLRAAVQRLQENARLELRNVAFCHKILSYGNYEKFPRDEFSPGQPVLVYAELSNFKSEPSADGQFRTMLRSTLEIYKAGPGGGLVERITFPATEDLCRNHRRDYFHSYEFTIPTAQKIGLGPHVLKLTVEDELSRKVSTYSLNFTVK